MRKTDFEIVSAAFEELEKLKPTPQEIQDYADLNQDTYGVVTYSKYKRGDYYFLRFTILGNKKLVDECTLTLDTLMKSLLTIGTFMIRLI